MEKRPRKPMKHLKLFENFDRYEFGSRDAMTYNQMRKVVEEFPLELNNQVGALLTAADIRFYVSDINEDGEYFDIFSIDLNDVMVEIYYLGDYCYGVYAYDNTGNEDGILLEVIDDIEELIPTVKRMISDLGNESILEDIKNVNKYEFGVYKLAHGIQYASLMLSKLGGSRITPEETSEISTLFKENDIVVEVKPGIMKGLEVVYRYKIFNQVTKQNVTTRKHYAIYNLGDYCYGLIAERENKYYILDQFESVLDTFKELFGMDTLVKENVDNIKRHEFGEYKSDRSFVHLARVMRNFNGPAMTVPEFGEIYNFIKANKIKAHVDFTSNYNLYVVKVKGGSYYIYNLGDYCYSIVDERGARYFILDQFESVMDKLKELLSPTLLNENLANQDRHEFGEYPLTDSMVIACQYMIDMGGKRLSDSEYDEIFLMAKGADVGVSNVFFREMNGLSIVQRFKKYRQGMVREDLLDYEMHSKEFVVYYLGDYCYSIMDFHGRKYYILDQFDSVLDKLKELLGIV